MMVGDGDGDGHPVAEKTLRRDRQDKANFSR